MLRTIKELFTSGQNKNKLNLKSLKASYEAFLAQYCNIYHLFAF